jgi:hypothetical protein
MTEITGPASAAAIAYWGAHGRWFSRRPQAVTASLLVLNLGAVNSVYRRPDYRGTRQRQHRAAKAV